MLSPLSTELFSLASGGAGFVPAANMTRGRYRAAVAVVGQSVGRSVGQSIRVLFESTLGTPLVLTYSLCAITLFWFIPLTTVFKGVFKGFVFYVLWKAGVFHFSFWPCFRFTFVFSLCESAKRKRLDKWPFCISCQIKYQSRNSSQVSSVCTLPPSPQPPSIHRCLARR